MVNAGIMVVPIDLLGGYFEGDQTLPPLLPGIGLHFTIRNLTDLRNSFIILGIHLNPQLKYER